MVQIPQKSIDMLNTAIAAKDAVKLKEMLHPSNKNWRKMFQESQNVKLPRTVQGTNQAVDNWASDEKTKV